MPEPLLDDIRDDARTCQRCPLYRDATQLVFGEGPDVADAILVGEQPGDSEDRQGRPFVGPAGRVLDEALHEAGLERQRLYLTNVVKHFKHEHRGKRRLHKRPNAYEIERCRWWLDLELAAVKAPVVVALGVTAASALLGRRVTLSRLRGDEIRFPSDRKLLATIHPSAVLRTPLAKRTAAMDGLVGDLRKVARSCIG